MPNNIEIRSEEIQELLTSVPSSIIRWGVTILFFCMILLLSISTFIKVPEKIEGAFSLYDTQIVTIYVPTKNSGRIKKNQSIILKLDNFPNSDLYNIKTSVDSLSFDIDKKSYVVHTKKLDSLTINKLPFITGTASIIVDEKRVISKILPFVNF